MELKTNASSSTIERSEVFAFTVLRAFHITSNEKKIMPGVLSFSPSGRTKCQRKVLFPRSCDCYRQNDDYATGDQLLTEFQSHQDQAVVDQANHKRSHDRSND